MLELCQRHAITNVTFAISVYHAALNPHSMTVLLNAMPTATLTLWGECPPAVRRHVNSSNFWGGTGSSLPLPCLTLVSPCQLYLA